MQLALSSCHWILCLCWTHSVGTTKAVPSSGCRRKDVYFSLGFYYCTKESFLLCICCYVLRTDNHEYTKTCHNFKKKTIFLGFSFSQTNANLPFLVFSNISIGFDLVASTESGSRALRRGL